MTKSTKIGDGDKNRDASEMDERLAQARARRAEAASEQDQDTRPQKTAAKFYASKIGESTQPAGVADAPEQPAESDEVVSVEDVLQTANLNDRMELARIRHAQILAKRKQGKTAPGGDRDATAPGQTKETIHFALGGRNPPRVRNPDLPPSEEVVSQRPEIAPIPIAAAPRKRRLVLPLVLILMIGLLAAVAVAVPGPVRDFVIVTANQAVERLAGLRGVTSPEDAGGRGAVQVGSGAPVSQGGLTSDAPQHTSDVLAKLPSPAATPNDPGQLAVTPSITPVILNRQIALFARPGIDASPPQSLGAVVPNYVALRQQSPADSVAQDISGDDAGLPLGLKPFAMERIELALIAPLIANLVELPTDLPSRSPIAIFVSADQPAPLDIQGFRDAPPGQPPGEVVPNYPLLREQARIRRIEQESNAIADAIARSPTPDAMDKIERVPRPFSIENPAALPPPLLRFSAVATSPVVSLSVPALPSAELTSRGAVSLIPTQIDFVPPAVTRILPSIESTRSGTLVPARFQAPQLNSPAQRISVSPAVPALAVVTVPPKAFVDKPAQNPFQNLNLLVQAPAGLPADEIDGLIETLKQNGISIAPPKTVSFTIRRTNVRYFRRADADAAGALALLIGAALRDFTAFRPSPPAGTVEVWLAGSAQARNTARTSGSGGTEDPALIELRNRLVESLRRGDQF